MKPALTILCLVVGIAMPAWPWPAAGASPAGDEAWQLQRFCIKWGLRTTTRQVWDGQVRLDTGNILDVTPFIRHEIPYDAMRVTATSWRSTTYIDAEGIYLTVRAPEDATVFVETVTCDLQFSVGDLEPGETKQHLEGDVEISNVTDQVLFRIAGLERSPPGKGTATIAPVTARAASLGTWTVTYTAPPGGVPVGGGIRLSWHFTRSWGEPQFTHPKGRNYVTVNTTGGCRLDWTSEHRGLLEYPFTRGRILVLVLDTPLREGEQIRVVLGDTSRGSPGFEAPVIAEEATAIRVEECTDIEEGRFPVYRRLAALPQVTVLPLTEPERLFIVTPSVVQAGSPFNAKVVVEDEFRNVVPSFTGPLEVLVGNRVVRSLSATSEDAGTLTIPDLALRDAGCYRVRVRQPDGDLAGDSNPIKCVAGPPSGVIVWGELHGHTELSDGYGSADDYLRFAQDRALLDFAAITDHDVELDAPDWQVADMWREVNAAVRRHHDPPRFCTVPAYEWSPARVTLSTMAPYGDHNVFYSKAGAPILKAEDHGSHTLPKLYDTLADAQDVGVQVISHVGGAVGNWEYHDSALENLAEIYSVHGSFESFGEIALQRGHTVGFVGAGDSHCGQIGGFPPGAAKGHYTHGGLTAVRVAEHSRGELLQSLARRQVYATTGERIYLDFSVNGEPMGSVLHSGQPPAVAAEVIGTAPLLMIEVVKNGRVIHTWTNEYTDRPELILLWGNRVEQADLLDFDRSLWSYYLRHVDWQGSLKTDRGRLALTETCSFDYPKDRVLSTSGAELRWRSETRGDWDGISVALEDPAAGLAIQLGSYRQSIPLADLPLGVTRRVLGPSDSLLLVKGRPGSGPAAFRFEDRTILHRRNYYYLRVLQADGEMAWSSPVWVAHDTE